MKMLLTLSLLMSFNVMAESASYSCPGYPVAVKLEVKSINAASYKATWTKGTEEMKLKGTKESFGFGSMYVLTNVADSNIIVLAPVPLVVGSAAPISEVNKTNSSDSIDLNCIVTKFKK